MKHRYRKHSTSMQIGMLSLPVMACLLAAVIYALPHSTPENVDLEDALSKTEPEAAETRAKVENLRKDVEKAISGLVNAQNLQAENERIAEQIKALLKEKERLQKCVTEAQEKAALSKRIAELNKLIADIEKEIALIDQKIKAVANRFKIAGLDEFPRPYITIECRKDTVTVYVPGQAPKSMSLPFSGAETGQLRSQIAIVKGVVVFARGASFHTTYSKVENALLYEEDIIKKRTDGTTETPISFYPVDDNVDLTGNILLGGGA